VAFSLSGRVAKSDDQLEENIQATNHSAKMCCASSFLRSSGGTRCPEREGHPFQ